MEFVAAASSIAYGREASYGAKCAAFGGSGGSTAQRFLGITNSTFNTADPQFDIKMYRSFGQGADYFNNLSGKASLAESFTFLPVSGEMLYYVFGTEAFTAGGTNNHLLTLTTAPTNPSFTLGVELFGTPNFTRIFTGCVIGRTEFSLSVGDELQMRVDYMAKTVDFAAATVTPQTNANAPFQNPYMFYDLGANLTLDATGYNTSTGTITGGRTIARVERFAASMTRSMKTKHYIQSTNAQFPFNYLNSYADFDLTVDVVPAGVSLGDGGSDQLYDLLLNTGSKPKKLPYVVLPFSRAGPSGIERLDLVFVDCLISSEPHSLPEDGAEVSVSIKLKPRSFFARVSDANGAYASA